MDNIPLIDFYEISGLLRFLELENQIIYLLGIKVDLIIRSAMEPMIGRRILQKVIRV